MWPPVTRTGCVASDVPPFPNCPYVLRPQHHASPSSATAQVCTAPAAIETKCSSLRTLTGVVRGAVVPSPSSPLAFLPQQYASPASVTPQACALPAVIDRNCTS